MIKFYFIFFRFYWGFKVDSRGVRFNWGANPKLPQKAGSKQRPKARYISEKEKMALETKANMIVTACFVVGFMLFAEVFVSVFVR